MSDTNQNKAVLYFGSPLYRNLTVNGQLNYTVNSNAIADAFKIWLTSGKGESVRSNQGGYLEPFLFKPLTLETAEKIKKSIMSGLQNEFTPKLTVVSLIVLPDLDNSRWVINLQAYNAQLNIGVNDTTIINSYL